MAAVVLDTTGEECPVPLEMAIEKIKTLASGAVLLVRSTDPVAPIDFEAWCERQPHKFLGFQEKNGTLEIRIRCNSS